jgi:hypothetical protein
LADEVGLGKTLSCWSSILNITSSAPKKVVIVAPLAVLSGWRQTIDWMGNGGNRILLINYDKLRNLFKADADDRKKIKSLKGVAKFAEAREFDVVVWDECHNLKNLTSARTKLAIEIYKATSYQIWLSATAGQNPLELGYLLPLLSKGTHKGTGTFAQQFESWCESEDLHIKRGKFGQWNWEKTTADCEKLNRILFNPVRGISSGIRRRPEDIAGWPSLKRIPTPVDLDEEMQSLYEQEWENFKRSIAQQPLKKVRDTAGMVALMRFRQKSSILRVDSTVELAEELLDDGHQVAISFTFLDSLNQVKDKLSSKGIECAVLTGETQDKENQRLLFQKRKTPVILFTVKEGINLQEGEYSETDGVRRSQIDHDLQWSAIAMHQIDGRCHRAGKFANVYWMYGKNTKEEYVAEVLLKRMSTMTTLNGDDQEVLKELEEIMFA